MQFKPLLVGLAVIVIAGGIFLAVRSSSPNANDTSDSASSTPVTDTTSDSTESNFSGSFSDLAARSGNWRCTFSYDMSGITANGVMYASGGQLRGDINSKVAQANMDIESHVIQSGGYMYIWSSLSPTGSKIKISTTTSAPTIPNQPVSMSSAYQYDCDPWNVDASVFVAPTNVTFTEVKSN